MTSFLRSGSAVVALLLAACNTDKHSETATPAASGVDRVLVCVDRTLSVDFATPPSTNNT